MCLCYGNELYTPEAKKIFGAVGCPPVKSEQERRAWSAYVEETVRRYTGRVEHFEVWNEPDGHWCWKHGVNPAEYAQLVIDTAKADYQKPSDKGLSYGADIR